MSAATVVKRPVSMVNLVNLTRVDLPLMKSDLEGRSCVAWVTNLEKNTQTDAHLVSCRA